MYEELLEMLGLSTEQFVAFLTDVLNENPTTAFKDWNAYFCGGTLCMDLQPESKSLYLCLFQLKGEFSVTDTRNGQLERMGKIPKDVTDIVRKIYLKVKGETEYFKKETQDN